MLDFFDEAWLAAFAGGAGGILLGLAARLGRFCTLGAIEDALYAGSALRLRMWGVAIGTAMLVSFALMQAGLITPSAITYLSFAWMPAASVIGGLMFGYGMALAGNCGYGALARLGGGDLRNFVIVLVMGLAAYATISGPLAPLRVAVFPQVPLADGAPLPGFAQLVERGTGLPAPAFGMALGLIILLAMFSNREMRAARTQAFWGIMAGLAVASGWGFTQWIATTGFDPIPVQSHSFAAPIGESLLWIMTASGGGLSFGIGSVAGVWTGAFIGSLIKGHFRWEACEDPRELRRQIIGASLMGVGAVLAFGCSIGQGLSGLSVLYYGAPVTLLAIVAGAAFGLRQLISGFAFAR